MGAASSLLSALPDAGLFLMTLFSLALEEIQMKAMDIVQAFGMTVGLGTVILFFCYLIDSRKTKK